MNNRFHIGEKYDKVTIINFDHSGSNNRRMAIVRCECGVEYKLRPHLLIINKTNNCGCSPRGSYLGSGELSGSYLQKVRLNARRRNIIYNITPEYLYNLLLKQDGKCAISGIQLYLVNKYTNYTEQTASIDRIDSKHGYIEGNVQWVHKHINVMKGSHSEEYFINLCKEIAKYNEQSRAIILS